MWGKPRRKIQLPHHGQDCRVWWRDADAVLRSTATRRRWFRLPNSPLSSCGLFAFPDSSVVNNTDLFCPLPLLAAASNQRRAATGEEKRKAGLLRDWSAPARQPRSWRCSSELCCKWLNCSWDLAVALISINFSFHLAINLCAELTFVCFILLPLPLTTNTYSCMDISRH
jgi:hypothetical protein